MFKRRQFFVASLVFFLFLWSFFLRFYQLGRVPTGLYWDETAILVDARSIAQTGKDMSDRPWYQVIYPSYGDYKSPVYIWLAGLVIKLIGASDFAVRVPSALAGITTIVTAGLIAKQLLESQKSKLAKAVGISTAVVVALSPWSILFSRTGFEAQVGQCFLALSVLTVLLSEKKKWLIFFVPIFGLLATYSYFSVRFVWLGAFCLLVFLFVLLPKLTKVTKRIQSFPFLSLGTQLILPLLIFGLGLLPMLKSPLYEASNTFRLSTDSVLQNFGDVIQSNVYREQAGNTRLDRIVFDRWWLTSKKLMSNYADNVSLNFLFINGDPNLRHGTSQHGLFLSIFMPFFFIGWYYLFKNYPKIGFLFVGWWLLALLPASVPNTTPHALRSLNALVPLSCVIGIGIAATINKLSNSKPIINWTISSLVLIFLFASLFQFSHYYFIEYPNLSTAYWQGGFEELTKLVFNTREGNEPVLVLPFDDRYYLWLLAYGPYPSSEIQRFPHSGYQIRDFDSIYTEHLPIEISKTALLVGSNDQVHAFMQQSQYNIVSEQFVKIPGQQVFEVAKLKQRQK